MKKLLYAFLILSLLLCCAAAGAQEVSAPATTPESVQVTFESTTYTLSLVGVGLDEDGKRTVSVSGVGTSLAIRNGNIIAHIQAAIEADGTIYAWKGTVFGDGIATFSFGTDAYPEKVLLYSYDNDSYKTLTLTAGEPAEEESAVEKPTEETPAEEQPADEEMAAGDIAKSLYASGLTYYFGNGVDLDYGKAREYFEMAAELGYTKAYNILGQIYLKGEGVDQNDEQAFLWYQKAAQQGDPDGQNNLAQLYRNGQGIEQDYAQAVQWYLKAADQGQMAALNNLGQLYRDGTGVEQDYEKAVEYFRQSAEQGNADATEQSCGHVFDRERRSAGFRLGVYLAHESRGAGACQRAVQSWFDV